MEEEEEEEESWTRGMNLAARRNVPKARKGCL